MTTFLETDDYIEDSLSNPLKILFRDEHLIAVFKPAGLLVHRSQTTLPQESILLQALRDQIGSFVFPVHRLDRPTAGIILFGLNRLSAAKMVQLFTDRSVDKYYQALVCGFTPGSFVVDRPLEEKFNLEADQHRETDNPTQDARTEFSRIEQYELPQEANEDSACRYSLLEIKPHTGRSHQIRRHLHHASFPVIGDHRHGDDEQNRRIFEKTGVCRMLLTAARLDFRHPYTGEMLTIATGRGSEFDRVVSYMRQFGSQKNCSPEVG
jgi:tRNA pseudouridine65 synthase